MSYRTDIPLPTEEFIERHATDYNALRLSELALRVEELRAELRSLPPMGRVNELNAELNALYAERTEIIDSMSSTLELCA